MERIIFEKMGYSGILYDCIFLFVFLSWPLFTTLLREIRKRRSTAPRGAFVKMAQAKEGMAHFSYSAQLEGHGDGLLAEFGRLLLEQRAVDLTLVSDSKSIKIHKVVLIACSPYFKERLSEGNENVVVFKTNFTVLMALVEFIYYGKTAYSEADAGPLIAAARLFQITGLSSIKIEGQPPDFPPPIFIYELSCSNGTVDKAMNHSNKENEPTNGRKKAANCHAKFPIALGEDALLNDASLGALKRKRGRPRRDSNVTKINAAIKETLEQEARQSLESFEQLKAIQANNKGIDEGLQMAIDSIRPPEATAFPHLEETDPLENLNPYSPTDKNDYYGDKEQPPNFVPILFEYTDGSFNYVSNEMSLDIAEDVECKIEETPFDTNEEFDEILNVMDDFESY